MPNEPFWGVGHLSFLSQNGDFLLLRVSRSPALAGRAVKFLAEKRLNNKTANLAVLLFNPLIPNEEFPF